MIEYYKNFSLENLFYINKKGLVCQEEWEDVVCYEGKYKVSNLGRIKSLKRKIFGGKVYYFNKEKILKQSIVSEGRLMSTLTNEAVQIKIKTHQLVAIVFLKHSPCGLEKVVDHINNNSLDNRLENLQIITQKENTRKDKNQKSGQNCVFFEKGKYRVRFNYNSKTTNFGRFNTKKEAVDLFLTIDDMILKGEDVSKYIKNRTNEVCRNISIHQNKFRVRVNLNKKTHRLGEFSNIEDAHKALSMFRENNGIAIS